jgi:hypothetical protein
MYTMALDSLEVVISGSGEDIRERVQEGECSGTIMYSCMKMEVKPIETIPDWEKQDNGE